ncbi:RML2 (YEL050C) [Zygosaccharomyces parabailii]|uniref:Large ribosomal subunit protein uL2m n=1 Tax=Zygosaccharomyces bailii (strain CLIB 213 / ATCC 58445 / CBS 680 / BCRC 21525 / NBRC 1098 / NCYC 1416 / NRRL Y-2227) TaxID=1333698 RepID=A0A8J2T9I9_ZYGB2|nr:RML2 (YEL050C) [Zygosaccharomyces parabailii]CDF89889.1 ZYBA0S05-04104g1_1 [Zygosaccharomyces bailii CLIB 213]CDH17647.1 probable 54S ribosomal protein RML2,mitochondrial [Zygosaccharomyces bailii ISA1307]SJM88668.1 probable 54S ribosomal protein RML2, mitochondrial [Zygosaccharomyces bailii]
MLILNLLKVQRRLAASPATRFFSQSWRSLQEASGTAEAQSVNPQMLKVIPDNEDVATLEKQDDLIKRRRKLSKEITVMKKLKPVSPGLRWWRKPIYPYLHKGRPILWLTKAKRGTGGRNNSGRITVRHRGGGHKRRLRIVDFSRWDAGAQTVQRIEYDPGRSAHIALVKHNSTNQLSYILACDGLRAGDVVESYRHGITKELLKEMGGKVDPAILSVRTAQRGNCVPISMIPIGSIVHNVGLTPVGPGKFCRAAGSYARILSKWPEKKKAVVRLQSGEHRYVSLEACATIGIVSNIDHQNRSLGKAGRSRWMGIRPTVRGVAMNKCDHPHGGGRGKSKSKKLSVSPWGQLAKGYKTRRGKHQNKMKVKDRPRGKVLRS